MVPSGSSLETCNVACTAPVTSFHASAQSDPPAVMAPCAGHLNRIATEVQVLHHALEEVCTPCPHPAPAPPTMSASTRVRDPDMEHIASLCARTFSRPTLPISSPVVCGTDIVLCDGWERTLGVARRVPNNGDWNGQQNNCLFLSISGALGKMTPGAMRAEMFAEIGRAHV